jgi:hypothetical protein
MSEKDKEEFKNYEKDITQGIDLFAKDTASLQVSFIELANKALFWGEKWLSARESAYNLKNENDLIRKENIALNLKMHQMNKIVTDLHLKIKELENG